MAFTLYFPREGLVHRRGFAISRILKTGGPSHSVCKGLGGSVAFTLYFPREGLERAGQGAYQCGGRTGWTWCWHQNIEGVALESGPGAAVLSALNALWKPSRG